MLYFELVDSGGRKWKINKNEFFLLYLEPDYAILSFLLSQTKQGEKFFLNFLFNSLLFPRFHTKHKEYIF